MIAQSRQKGQDDDDRETRTRHIGARTLNCPTLSLKVAALAEAAGMPVTPHSPIDGPASAIKAQFASLVPNAGVYQGHRARKPVGDWYASQFSVDEQGTILVPDGPGWGITYE